MKGDTTMTQVEKSYNKIVKELEKLNARLERANKAYEKKYAIAEKLGVAEWSNAEYNEFMNNVETTADGWIVNKEDVKKNGAWFDLYSASEEVKDVVRQIENAEKRLAKITGSYNEQVSQNAEEERINKMETSFYNFAHKTEEQKEREKKEFEEWLERFKAECLKDGVIIEEYNGWYISGKTKSGKHFSLYGNSGFTARSFHCYTLHIDGQLIFTSGEFYTAYRFLKQ